MRALRRSARAGEAGATRLPHPGGYAGPAVLVMLLGATAAACEPENPVSPFVRDSIAVAWRTPVSDEFVGRELAADDARLFALVDGITAYHLATGARAWQAPLNLSRGPSGIVTANSRVFVASSQALALDAATGAELWRFTPDSVAPAEPAVDERALYIGTESRRVYALDVATGRAFWSAEVIPQGAYPARLTRIVVSGDSVYASVVEETSPTGHLKRGWLVALDRLTGRVLWRYVNERANEAHDSGGQVVAGRMLLANDLNGGAILGIDRFTGQEVWRYVGPGDRFGARDVFSVAEGVAYLASNDTHAYAIDPATGRFLWKKSLLASLSTSAVCGEYVFAAAGSLHMLRRADGSEKANLFLDEWNYVQPDAFVVSRLLARGSRVYFLGYRAVYAVECA